MGEVALAAPILRDDDAFSPIVQHATPDMRNGSSQGPSRDPDLCRSTPITGQHLLILLGIIQGGVDIGRTTSLEVDIGSSSGYRFVAHALFHGLATDIRDGH